MTQTITIKNPKAPATPAQIGFLTSLIEKNDCPTVAERYAFAQGFLTMGAASKLIDEAKAAPKKPYQAPVAAPAPKPLAVAVEEIAATLTELPAFGYYMIDGTLYYWDVTGKDLFPQLRKLVVVHNYDGSKKGSWKKIFAGYGAKNAVEATYTPYNGKGWNPAPVTKLVKIPVVLAEAVLAGVTALSQDDAGKLGKQFGFCVRCGATLTDPVSVANGIGPVCAKYWA